MVRTTFSFCLLNHLAEGTGDHGAAVCVPFGFEDGRHMYYQILIVLTFVCFRFFNFTSAGNKRFREVITDSIPEYNRADSRLEKSLVVHSIVESIRSEGGRFLKEDRSTGNYFGKSFFVRLASFYQYLLYRHAECLCGL